MPRPERPASADCLLQLRMLTLAFCAAAVCLWPVVAADTAAAAPPAARPAPPAAARGARMSRVDGMNYLSRFGYISPSLGVQGEDVGQIVSEALKSFQRMARINETGSLDEATERMMEKPRCGVLDPAVVAPPPPPSASARRSRRYLHAGSKWNLASKPTLTWRVSRYTPQLRQADVDRELERALQVWAEVTPLRFERRSSGPVDIDIAFASHFHGDAYPFDNRGGVLAHAFFPPTSDVGFTINGDTHFDESEPWMIAASAGTGVSLFYVAVHEFGHALGLQHSNVPGSIMWPWAGSSDPNNPPRLAYDDIMGIQTLYGSNPTRTVATHPPVSTTLAQASTRPPPTTMRPTTVTVRPSPPTTTPIRRPSSTATTARPQTTTTPTRPTTAASTARLTTSRAPPPPSSSLRVQTTAAATKMTTTTRRNPGEGDCPSSLDEIVQAVDGHVYGFRGGRVYRFMPRAPGFEAGYPKPIGNVFPNSPPDGVDAAVTYRGPFASAKTYLFKGDRYYRYSLNASHDGLGESQMVLDNGFPKSLSQGWGFQVKDFDAAFLLNDDRSIYFVKGSNYWRHSGTSRGALGGYPRNLTSHPVLGQLPGVKAAFRHSNGRTYFFNDMQYYRYNQNEAPQPNGQPSVIGPRPVALWWFGCVLDRLRMPSMSDADEGDSSNDPR